MRATTVVSADDAPLELPHCAPSDIQSTGETLAFGRKPSVTSQLVGRGQGRGDRGKMAAPSISSPRQRTAKLGG